MFKYIDITSESGVNTTFCIRDSDFSSYQTVMRTADPTIRIVSQEVALIREYQNRQLNVAKTIARYYLLIFKHYQLHRNIRRLRDGGQVLEKIIRYRTCLDAKFPELNYGDKYFPCVMRQMEREIEIYHGKENI